MSAAHDAHADASAGHHDAHDHFDNEPATELGADEPRTPAWLPYLGLALFFSAGVACLVCSEDKPADEKPAAAAVEAAPAPPPLPQGLPQVPPQLAPMRPGQPAIPVPVQAGQPGQPGAGAMPTGLKQLSPEQARELQRLIEQRQGQPGGAVPGRPVPQPGAVPQPAAPPQPVPPGQPAHL